jgi:hypothetical protein
LSLCYGPRINDTSVDCVLQMIDGHTWFEEHNVRLKWVPVHPCPSKVHSKLSIDRNLGPISASSSRLWLHLLLVSVRDADLKDRLPEKQSLHDHREHLLYF